MLFMGDWNGREPAKPCVRGALTHFAPHPHPDLEPSRTCEGRERVSNTGNASGCCTVVRTRDRRDDERDGAVEEVLVSYARREQKSMEAVRRVQARVEERKVSHHNWLQ
jgi:hypothetical protein